MGLNDLSHAEDRGAATADVSWMLWTAIGIGGEGRPLFGVALRSFRWLLGSRRLRRRFARSAGLAE
jgi:hypothetical protein